MNEVLIITYEELHKENIKLSKFGNDVKKMINHIQCSSHLIQECSKQVSRQTFIILFRQLTAYKTPDFQCMFGAFYEQLRNQSGKGFELSLNQLFTKANSEYTHLICRNQWKSEEESQVMALMAEVRGLRAIFAKFNNHRLPAKPFDEKLNLTEGPKKPGTPFA